MTKMSTPSSAPSLGYYLGCPQWTHQPWMGSIYPKSASINEALSYYSKAFNSVEGNTTFYASPSPDTIQKWADRTPETFRFLFKFPKLITHDALLEGPALEEAYRFIDLLKPLEDRCAYLFLQLSPRLTLNHLSQIHHFLIHLPSSHQYVLEMRDPQACRGKGMDDLHQFLIEHRVERVWMDTRPLRDPQAPSNDAVDSARTRKPNLPVYPVGLGPCPVIRYVAHPVVEHNHLWLTQWADVFARWIKQGKTPFFFAHYPGETYAPQVARAFHQLLQKKIQIPNLPTWPGEQQLSLF